MIKFITHNDLDGLGCYIVARTLLDKEIEVEYCNYGEVNNVVLETIENEEKYEQIFITDISVTEEVAKKLDSIKEKVVLLDHHITALFLNEYTWANVKEYDGDEKTCATSLVYDYLVKAYGIRNINPVLTDFVRKTRLYDTWLWFDKYNDESAKQLNDLRYILGKDEFTEDLIYKIVSKKPLINDFDLKLLKIKQREIDEYVDKKNRDLIITSIKDSQGIEYKAGVVIAESNQSELGNRLSNMNPDLDFIVMIGQNGMSYRTSKEDVDLSKIAKQFGGGGHPKASGSPVPKETLQIFIDELFKI